MKIGFIGMGNMAKAIASGFIASRKIQKENIFAFAPNQEKLKKNAGEIGFIPCESILSLSDSCDVFIMACKPYQIEGVLSEIQGRLFGKVLVSVAAA